MAAQNCPRAVLDGAKDCPVGQFGQLKADADNTLTLSQKETICPRERRDPGYHSANDFGETPRGVDGRPGSGRSSTRSLVEHSFVIDLPLMMKRGWIKDGQLGRFGFRFVNGGEHIRAYYDLRDANDAQLQVNYRGVQDRCQGAARGRTAHPTHVHPAALWRTAMVDDLLL